MKTQTIHLGFKIVSGNAIHYCNGRAVSNRFSITEDPARATCKRCLKKFAALPAPRKTISWVVGGEVFECQVEQGACPFCHGFDLVVKLPAPVLAEQPDDTTHVCHPGLGGCNQGFAKTA